MQTQDWSTRGRRALSCRTACGVAVVLLLSGCASAANPYVTHGHDVAGFWLGLWHGLILPVTFVVSLFNDRVGIYAARNSGHLYDLGFVMGAGGLSAPGFLSRSRSRRRRDDR